MKENEKYSRIIRNELGYVVECYDGIGMVFTETKDTMAEADEIAKDWINER